MYLLPMKIVPNNVMKNIPSHVIKITIKYPYHKYGHPIPKKLTTQRTWEQFHHKLFPMRN